MKLMEKPGYETIIGDGRHLTEYMKNLIKQERITESQAMSIKDNLKNSFDAGNINEKQLIVKAHEMFSDFQYEYEWFFGNVLANDETCPICFEKMDYEEGICHNCAFDVEMVDLSLKNFQDMHQFAKFVESHENLRDTRDMYLENDYGGDHLYTDLLLETYLDDSLKREYDNLHLNDWVDLDEMYGEDVHEEEFHEESYQPIQMSEMEFCKMADNKYRLVPRNHDSYVMPVRLKQYEYYKSVEELNDADLALHDLAFVPWCFRERLRDASFEEGFLTHNACKANWADFSKDLNSRQLKEFLGKYGIKNSGNKRKLIRRIADSDLPIEEFHSEKTFLTERAYELFEEYGWIDFYLDVMFAFDFLDYEDYLIDHEGNREEITSDYLDEHIRMANESLDFNYIMMCYVAKSEIYHSMDDLESALECDIRILHLNMNPICMEHYMFSSHIPLTPENVSNLKELKSEFGEEKIRESFDENWNFMGFKSIIIPKDEVWSYLIAALNAPYENHGSRKIREKYFMHFDKQ